MQGVVVLQTVQSWSSIKLTMTFDRGRAQGEEADLRYRHSRTMQLDLAAD
jgi:hypothetical protein